MDQIIVKAIEFKKFDLDSILDFLKHKRKTQVVDYGCVYGRIHALHSVFQTLKAFRNNENISNKEEIEFLLRLSGKRQIGKALEYCKPKKKSIFISWDKKNVFEEFRKNFDFREIELQKISKEGVKDALERSAVFAY